MMQYILSANLTKKRATEIIRSAPCDMQMILSENQENKIAPECYQIIFEAKNDTCPGFLDAKSYLLSRLYLSRVPQKIEVFNKNFVAQNIQQDTQDEISNHVTFNPK